MELGVDRVLNVLKFRLGLVEPFGHRKHAIMFYFIAGARCSVQHVVLIQALVHNHGLNITRYS